MTPTFSLHYPLRKLALCVLFLTAFTTPVFTQGPDPTLEPDTDTKWERNDHPLPRGFSIPLHPGSGDSSGSLYARHLTSEHLARFVRPSAHTRARRGEDSGAEPDVAGLPKSNPYTDPAPVGVREPVVQLENNNWVIKLSVGTPPQALEAVIQTHIDGTVFPGAKTGPTYQPDQSESGKSIVSTAPKDEEYYTWTSDEVTIGDKTLTDVAIGVPLNDTDDFDDTGKNKGILGLQLLTPQEGRDITPAGAENFFSAAAKQLGLGSDGGGAMVGLALGLDCQSGAEVSIGGVNPDLFDAKTLRWLDSTKVGRYTAWGAHISYEGVQSELPALFLSAGVTNYIWAEDAKKVFDNLGLKYEVDKDSGDVTAEVSCDDPPVYEIKVGEYTTKTSPHASVIKTEKKCISSLIGDGASQNAWFAGLPFFMGTYVIFDAAEKRMGFADRIVDNSKCADPAPTVDEQPKKDGTVSQQGNDPKEVKVKAAHEGIGSAQGASPKAAGITLTSADGIPGNLGSRSASRWE